MYIKHGKFAILSSYGRSIVIVPGTAIPPDAFLDKPGNEESDRAPAYLVCKGVSSCTNMYIRFIDDEVAYLPDDEMDAIEITKYGVDCCNRIAVFNSFRPNGYHGFEEKGS